MSEDNNKPKIVRRLVIEVYEGGNWQLNLEPNSPGLVQFDVIGILATILAQLQYPPTVNAQAINEGAADVCPV